MTAPPPADVTVTLACNNRCSFCPRETLEHVWTRQPEELQKRLAQICEVSSRVVLTGGEVTTLPDLPGLIRRCRALGFRDVAMITNGRLLADAGRVDELVDAGITEVCVTVYSAQPDVHDGMTGVDGSLAQTLAGLDQLLAANRRETSLTVRVNTLLCSANADGMLDLLQMLTRRGVRGFLVGEMVLSQAFPEPLGHGFVRRLAQQVTADASLRAAEVTWRGFPLCLLHDLDGVAAEAQNIDTTVASGAQLDEYFAEYFSNFVRADACETCALSHRCPGIQRLYLDQLGADQLSAVLPEEDTLDGYAAERDPGRLEVTPTLACQLRCEYCLVELGRRDAQPGVLDRAVDLLLTSSRTDLELQFFGGEPLLCRDEIQRSMRRGARRARERGKQLHFTITTNGLLLDDDFLTFLRGFDVHVLFSMDGPREVMRRQRALKGGGERYPFETIEANLKRLIRSGVPYFVNLVAVPGDTDDLPRRVEYLARLGVGTVQLCYAMGGGWHQPQRDAFCAALEACIDLAARRTGAGQPLRIQNLGSDVEPTMLGNDMLVDVDGTLYSDAAVFCEKALPGLRGPYRIGDIFELEQYDGLRRTRRQNLDQLRSFYGEGSPPREVVETQMTLGRQVQRLLDRLEPQRSVDPPPPPPRTHGRVPVKDRNPLLQAVLKRSLPQQVQLMRRRPELLKLPLLLLENPCAYDCLFCRAKPLPPTPSAAIKRWLEGNREMGHPRLGLVGNEPLLHPRVDGILAEARRQRFERFDVLTAAAPLADSARAEELVRAGVTRYAIPLYAADAGIHDAITQAPGSFDHALRAIHNLTALGATVQIHANVVRQNLASIPALERLVRDELGLTFCLIPVRPKDANRPYAELVPRYADIARLQGVASLVGFPLCIARQVQQPALADAAIIADVLKIYVLDQPFIKPPVCDGCGDKGRCAGTFQAYVELFGAGELVPR